MCVFCLTFTSLSFTERESQSITVSIQKAAKSGKIALGKNDVSFSHENENSSPVVGLKFRLSLPLHLRHLK